MRKLLKSFTVAEDIIKTKVAHFFDTRGSVAYARSRAYADVSKGVTAAMVNMASDRCRHVE